MTTAKALPVASEFEELASDCWEGAAAGGGGGGDGLWEFCTGSVAPPPQANSAIATIALRASIWNIVLFITFSPTYKALFSRESYMCLCTSKYIVNSFTEYHQDYLPVNDFVLKMLLTRLF